MTDVGTLLKHTPRGEMRWWGLILVGGLLLGLVVGVILERPHSRSLKVVIENPLSLHAGGALVLNEEPFMSWDCPITDERTIFFDDGTKQLIPSDSIPDGWPKGIPTPASVKSGVAPKSMPIPISSHTGDGYYQDTKSRGWCDAMSGVFKSVTASTIPVRVHVFPPEVILTKVAH